MNNGNMFGEDGVGDTTEPLNLQMQPSGSRIIVQSVKDEIGHVAYIKQEPLDCMEMGVEERDGNVVVTVVKEEPMSWGDERGRDLSLVGGNVEVCYGSERSDVNERSDVRPWYGSEKRDDISITKNEPSWSEGDVGGSDAKVEPTGSDFVQDDIPVYEDLRRSDVMKQEPVDPEFVNVGVVKVEPQDNEAATVMGVDPLAVSTVKPEVNIDAGGTPSIPVQTVHQQQPGDEGVLHSIDSGRHGREKCQDSLSCPSQESLPPLHPPTYMCLTCMKVCPVNDPTHEHEDRSPYKCPTCPLTFILSQNLTVHLQEGRCRRQDEGRDGPAFGVTSAWRKGSDTNQKDDCLERYECSACGKSFTRRKTLNYHVRHDCGRSEPHRCPICNRAFNQRCQLNYHVKHNCARTEPYVCPACKKHFTLKESWSLHVRLDCNRLKSHVCPTCGSAYRLRKALNYHVRHDCGRAEPHTCPTCYKVFSKLQNLKKHLKRLGCRREVHQCGICWKTFASPENLLAHVQRVCNAAEVQRSSCST